MFPFHQRKGKTIDVKILRMFSGLVSRHPNKNGSDSIDRTMKVAFQPVVNFTNILRATFPPFSCAKKYKNNLQIQ